MYRARPPLCVPAPSSSKHDDVESHPSASLAAQPLCSHAGDHAGDADLGAYSGPRHEDKCFFADVPGDPRDADPACDTVPPVTPMYEVGSSSKVCGRRHKTLKAPIKPVYLGKENLAPYIVWDVSQGYSQITPMQVQPCFWGPMVEDACKLPMLVDLTVDDGMEQNLPGGRMTQVAPGFFPQELHQVGSGVVTQPPSRPSSQADVGSSPVPALVFDPAKVKIEPVGNWALQATPRAWPFMATAPEGSIGSPGHSPQDAIIIDDNQTGRTQLGQSSPFDWTRMRVVLHPAVDGSTGQVEAYVPMAISTEEDAPPDEARSEADLFRDLERCIKTTQLRGVVDKIKSLQNIDLVRELLIMADIESGKHKDSEKDGTQDTLHSLRRSLGALETTIDLLEAREKALEPDRSISTVEILGSKRRIHEQWRSGWKVKKGCRRGEAVEHITPLLLWTVWRMTCVQRAHRSPWVTC